MTRSLMTRSRGLILALQVLVALVFLLFWHVSTTTTLFADPRKMQFFFSTPLDVLARTWRQFASGEIWYHLGITLTETVLAFVFGAVGGVMCGFLLARRELMAAVFDPYIKAANALPRVVLAPIFALWFGLGIWSKVALGFTLVFFIVFFAVFQGVREVSQTVLANARMLGLNERQLMRHVYWPAAMTWMFASLHTAVGFALVGAVVGEYLGSSAGLGYKIHEAESVFDVTGVFAGMLILMIFVIVIDAFVTLIENRLLVWRPGQTSTSMNG
jgi:NitT/TauT family transport system permease protein